MNPHALFESAETDPETGEVSHLAFLVEYDQSSAFVRIRLSPSTPIKEPIAEIGRRELLRFATAVLQTANDPGLVLLSGSLPPNP